MHNNKCETRIEKHIEINRKKVEDKTTTEKRPG